MSKKIIFVILFFAQFFTFNLFAQDAPSAAVMKFARSKGIDSEFAETVSSIVRNEVQQMEKYDVVNKFPIEFEDILLVLDCKIDDNKCLLKVAKQLNASVLVFGSIHDKGERIQIILNLFDVQKEKIDKKLIRFFDKKKDPIVEFRTELQYFFGTKKPDELRYVKIDSNVPKAKVYINDKFVGLAPLSKTDLKPGVYQIRVEATGHSVWQTRIKISEKSGDIPVFAQLQGGIVKKDKVVVSKPDKTIVQEDKDIVRPIENDSSLNWGALGVTGIGLATMATSVVFALQFEDTESIIAERRANSTLTLSGYNELVDKGQNQELLHFIFLGSGAAITTVGLVWFAINPTHGEHEIGLRVSPQHISATLSF